MLKRTSLFEEHQRLGGRLVDFGGWELPVQYSGVIEEHLSCRAAAGIFDVSHMGEIHVEGERAEAFLNFAVSNNVARLAVGQAQYTVMCNDQGGIVDDQVIYRRARDRFLVVVNASNTGKDFAHIEALAKPFDGLVVTNESARYSQIAVQGPRALEITQKLTETPLDGIKTYWFAEGQLLAGSGPAIPAVLARTGYTGEDGFELYVAWEKGPEVWRALLEAGAPLGLKPCGLGARDTLRLEMKYPLYGNELSDETDPVEAGLGWVVKLDKADFVGKAAVIRNNAAGLQRKLVGLRLLERGIARHGHAVFTEDGKSALGEVTSGTQSPSLRQSIAIAYVKTPQSAVGSRVSVEIRGQKVPAEVVATPFYKRL